MTTRLRSVKQILAAPPTHWVGDGFKVFPVFADKAFTEELSPFLMFDYAAPKKFPPNSGTPKGVGQHPHRGFETVTIAFNGEVEHADSVGNRGVIQPGDVQWMTAGRGIIHQEFHSTEFSQRGGIFEMCQLWVNLKAKDKMTPPKYQGISDSDIPVVDIPNEGGSVRVIAGSLLGTKGPAHTHSDIELFDVSLKEGKDVDLPFPAEHNCIVFVRRGGIDVLTGEDGDETYPVGPQDVALMKRSSGNTLRVRASAADTSLLIMGGEPLNEPIAARGPFVMNTWDEIQQANIDFRSGNFGR